MDIVFQYEEKRLVLPVNPESLQMSASSSAQKVNIIGIGQVSIPQQADLKTISIKSFFWKYLFDNTLTRYANNFSRINDRLSSVDEKFGTGFADDSKKFKLIIDYIKWFEDWRDSKKPARFTVVTKPNEPQQYFDMDVTCESFNYEIKAGEEEDYYYEMQLLEYRHYEAKELNAETKNNKEVVNPPQKSRFQTLKEKVKEIRVKPVDTVWSLAKMYGSGEFDDWKKLYNIGYNRNIIANNLKTLPNKVLQMPKEWL